ncbi:SHOCT domain-containing protein [Salinarchaeum sp. IM2453]|uniref:SHOCT domain-containing protein n=1 Tax=Salinarchaeum sp. IM2453 TaxID=2862870 RepID=UPI002105AE86|nr:SHOCT domain-containing protein [Salinarchaeum sp. IM2453]
MEYDFWPTVGIAIAAMLVAAVIPVVNILAPLIGGAVAAYISRANAHEGAKIGGIAGAIIPLALVPLALLAGFSVGAGMGGALTMAVLPYMFFVAIIGGAGALGGFLGGHYNEENHSVEPADRSRGRSPEATTSSDTEDDPVDTLKQRYARGEIDEIEFERRLENLLDDRDDDFGNTDVRDPEEYVRER